MSEEIVRQIYERIHADSAFRQKLFAAPWYVLQEFALTEEEKQALVVPNFSWLIEKRLAGASYPYSEDAIALLRELGVQALLSLAEEPLSEALLAKYQLEVAHLPLGDFSAPMLAQIEQAISIIESFFARGLAIAVHCGAGLGRTGTILACYLVSQGETARDAIAQVRQKRPGSIETPEQAAAIEAYEKYWRDKI